MIPIKLIIEGIFSYQKRQTIDFKKLSDNHLFGIFGTVGSGKSSILDAITYALYGKTDRFDKKGDNSNYNLMNLKSDQLFIEFDFVTGTNLDHYKVIVQGKRNSKNFEEVRTISRTAYKKINEEFVPIDKNELEESIGLSYNNFKRTIIIPQGKFQEFIQLPNTDRTRMMKELFQLDKYELYSKAKKVEDKNNEIIQTIKGNLEQIGDISENQFKEIQTRKTEIENTLTSLNSKHKTLLDIVKEFDRLQELTIKLKEYASREEQLKTKKQDIDQLEKNIKEYEYCAIHFKSICESITKHNNKITDLEKSIKENTDKLKEHNNTLEIKSVDFNKNKTEYDKLNDYHKELDNIRKLSDIAILKEKIAKETSRLKKGEQEVEKVTGQLAQSELKETTIAEKIKSFRDSLPNIEELSKAQQWHLENDTYSKNTNELTAEIKKLSDSTEMVYSNLDSIHSTINQGNLEKKAYDNWPDQIKAQINIEEQKLSGLNVQLEKWIVHAGLKDFAQNLEDGTPCPLCGSEHHPAPFNNDELTLKVDQLRKEKAQKENEIKNLNKQHQQVSNLLLTLTPIKTQINTLQLKYSNIVEQQKQHQKNIVLKYKDQSLVKETISTANQNEKLIKNLENEHAAIKTSHSNLQKNKERFQAELLKIQKEVESHDTSIKLLNQQISEKCATKYAPYSNQQLSEEHTKIEAHINNTQKQYTALQKDIEEIRKKVDQQEGNLNANQTFLKNEQNDLINQKQVLEVKIKESSFSDASTIKQILLQNIDIDGVKKTISDFNKENELVANKVSELQEQLKNKTYRQEDHIAHQESLKTIVSEINAFNIKLGESKVLLDDLRNKLNIKKELDKKLSALTLRADNIKTIKKLFYGSGFVNYVSSVYLQNLCSAANERFFKMTRQKLSLELSEDNNFIVRDFLNGGKLRSAKTLSGGQTFQAALALALALADNVQSITQTEQNFFFLDEGFGSLDKESLDVVFSTLKSLRKENRIVGIISHVEELQQEIPLYLQVTQDEEEGSFIKESF